MVHKRFGEEIRIDYYPNEPTPACSLIREMKVEEGTREDWKKLSVFHYRGHGVSVPRKIFRMVRVDELCGVIVYSYPPPACYGRRQVLPKMTMQELNKQLSIINRIVIHPKYRTIGLGEKLIRETLPQAGTLYVEMMAVMAKYSPFAEKAGMRKIIEQQSVESVREITDLLNAFGFDLRLLSSERYVVAKIECLTERQMNALKTVLMANKHPRLKREVGASRHEPFGRTSDYIKYIQNSDSYKITKLIRVIGVLSQTKVYLFWNGLMNSS